MLAIFELWSIIFPMIFKSIFKFNISPYIKPIFPILKSKWSTKSDYFSEVQEQTARLAKALAHPIRIAILKSLKYQSVCYHGDIAEELPFAKSTLSQHLKELKIVFTKKSGLK